MQKTINVLNTVWHGSNAEVCVAPNRNVKGVIDNFSWVINEDTYSKGIVYIKVVFSSLSSGSAEESLEYLVNINNFAISRA